MSNIKVGELTYKNLGQRVEVRYVPGGTGKSDVVVSGDLAGINIRQLNAVLAEKVLVELKVGDVNVTGLSVDHLIVLVDEEQGLD